MKSKKSYLKLSPGEKRALVERSLKGESVSNICKEAGVSRTIFYRWKKQSTPQKIGLKKHWRKLKSKKEQEIVRLFLNNPRFSIRKIAKEAQVSVGGAFNVINNYKKQAHKSGKKIRRYVKRSYTIFTGIRKIDLIKKYYQGEPIAKIAREAGVSRTIFYRWLKTYGDSGRVEIMERSYPREEKHWRFRRQVRDAVLEIISENPKLSLSKIAIEVRNKGESISKSGLYYILKNMQISTPQDRIAYISSQAMQPARYSMSAYAARLLPQFAVFTLFWFIVAVFLLSSISNPPVINYPFTISSVPTQIETRKDDYSKIVDEENNVLETSPKPQRRVDPPSIKLWRAKQDFFWGAMSINSPKDSYETGENIELGFGVVDHAGNTICDAQIGLEIVNAQSEEMFANGILDKKVMPSGQCSLQSITNSPDYKAEIPPLHKEGDYSLNIKATTYEGKREFKQKLLVANSLPFEIERVSYPTRIFPEAIYPVEIKIKANKDFKGTISENLPEGIKASNISGRGVLFKKSRSQEHEIKWRVDLKKGDVYSLRYNMHFPQIWPEFYEIGPLRFTDKKTGKLVFQEARYWQIVADAL